MRKPSVLFINRVYAPAKGASGRLLSDLAQAFAADGWDASVVTTGVKRTSGFENSVFVQRIPAKTHQSAFNYIAIWLKLFYAALKFKKTDLIVTMTDPPLLVVAGRLLGKRKKSYHIHWCQDVYPDLLPHLGIDCPEFLMKILQNLARNFTRTCHRVIVIGRCMSAHQAKKGVDRRRLITIPNWADKEFSEKNLQAKFHDARGHEEVTAIPAPKTEKPLLVDTGPKFRVLYAGNIGRAHPLTTILDAAAILKTSHPEIEFIFVGEGPGYDRLAVQRTRKSLENVRLLPSQPGFQLRQLMQSGDVHIISIKQDVAGLLAPCKLYSALAAERPCIFIGPAQSETARVITEYRAGVVLAQGHGAALADSILSYRMDGQKWLNAHQGASRAAQDFRAEKSIKNWIACARTTIRYPAQ